MVYQVCDETKTISIKYALEFSYNLLSATRMCLLTHRSKVNIMHRSYSISVQVIDHACLPRLHAYTVQGIGTIHKEVA